MTYAQQAAIAAGGFLLIVSAVFALPPSLNSAKNADDLELAPPTQRFTHALCQLGGINQVRCLSYSARPAVTAFASDKSHHDD